MLLVLEVPITFLARFGAVVGPSAARALRHLLRWLPAAEAEEASSGEERDAGDLALVFHHQGFALPDV